ncbi:hypothetical protein EBR43_11590 [bacterium]|nr:hypothetical protein [bacterium]
MKKSTKLKGKYLEDYTIDDIENLSSGELKIFYIFIQLFLLDEINDLIMQDPELKTANQVLSKFKR